MIVQTSSRRGSRLPFNLNKENKVNKFIELKWISAALSLLFMTACLNIGPRTIARDRFDYASAISESWKDNMLLNLVKIRYADAIVFLDIASITNQYELEGRINLDGTLRSGLLGDSAGAGGSAKYTDRPTITYNPLMGTKFRTSLMQAIPPEALLTLMQAGWSADFVFRCCVQAINGIYNRTGGQIGLQQIADPRFYDLIDTLNMLQGAGALGFRVKQQEGKKIGVCFFRRMTDNIVSQKITKAKELLGLDQNTWEFKLSYGPIAEGDKDISILTRTMLEILGELASHIDVPPEHVTENRATPNWLKETEEEKGIEPLLQIKSQKDKPSDALVAVKYRDFWFWIDDRDLTSKRTFSFLMFLFSLAEKGTPEMAPLLTIPAG